MGDDVDRLGDTLARVLSAPIAHRGLWTPGGPPENSVAAFLNAVDDGYGVELDVRLSRDGAVMVFHDRHLARMAASASDVSAKTAAELSALRLKGTTETIPTLAEVLSKIAGGGPALIELKTEPGSEGPLELGVAEALDHYVGPAAVIGFNAASHAWFASHRPGVLRGLNLDLSSGSGLDEDKLISMLQAAQPHFLLPGLEGLDEAALASLRQRGLPLVVWTVRDPLQWAQLEAYCATLIFEGWRP